ncbi:MAG: redoxin family protein, partial [Deltaproteobacteria bacterium]
MQTSGRSRNLTISTAAAFVFTASLLSIPGVAGADDAESANKSTPDLELTILDTEGVPHALRPNHDRAALVVVFLGTECPIANGCIPELNRQFAELVEVDSRVAFFGVISDRSVTRAVAARHATRFNIKFPVLFDASGELAAALKPTHTPEAFVIDRDGRLAYRGRIDDLYADLGKKRTEPSRHDLAEAIADVLAARPVAIPRTKPVGCLYEPVRKQNGLTAVTYTRDVAPIMQAHCVQCHRDNEIAPFPLVSYADLSKRARQLVRVTQSRLMPPWKPEPGFGHFLNERRLTERERALLAEWADAGAPEGDPDNLPPPRKFAEGWQLGEPDLVVKIDGAFEVPAGGRDV